MKSLIYSIAITSCFYCTAIPNNSELNDESIIINKIIDTVCVNEVRPKSVFIGEQVLSELNQYLTGRHDQRSDSLSLLINGKWNYLKQIQSHSYSKEWKQISLPKSISGKKIIREKKKEEDIRLSPIQFSPDGARAFVVYYRTVKNIPQTTVFFFFEKKNANWTQAAHYIPFFD